MKKGIIIGGGIGGLTTAVALLKKGIEIKVYEQAPEIKAVGAGLWMAANALQVFERLGFVKEVIAKGNEFTEVNILNIHDKIISSIDCVAIKSKFGQGNIAIHRADLQEVILNQLPENVLQKAKVFERYEQNENSVKVFFQDGTSDEADFLIAADGIHSKARQQFLPTIKLRYDGQTCWRFVSNMTLPNPQKAQEIWAYEKGLRVGFSQISPNQVYCYITNFQPQGGKDNKASIKEDLLRLCADFQPIVKEIIENIDPEKVLRNDIFDFAPMSKWQDKKVVLLGDAAHATTPNMGQGACQAIEDAYVIAECLAKAESVEMAFSQFQQLRIKKAHHVVKTSWMLGKVTNTSGFLKKILIFLMAMTPKSVNQQQFEKVYEL
jgi:2-polyprenyl-6-methoxyphenol hydroxylase-like FAD-dependent oxidoreductase